jgi:hypothetical protein
MLPSFVLRPSSFVYTNKDLRVTQRCLADIGGPFYDPTKPFRNWSALPFYQLDLSQRPYVDQQQLAQGVARALAYIERIHAQGYTGIVIDNLMHLVTFERAPLALYPADSPYRVRALIYRVAFSQLFERAAQLGMEIFVTTDMQWSTPPVRAYAGRMSAANPQWADVNRWALEELFALFPQVGGLVVRTGEAGGAHNQEVGYASHVLYSSTAGLRDLIATLLPVCARHQRLLIMRTWSIGIGELGDLLWSPERYRAVFSGFDSPWLLASIKHGPSDFFRLLPHNPTLGLPGPQQIVELQNRREYELFGMVPSSIAQLHQDVLQHAQASNPRYAGVWAWNSTGGWGGGRAAIGAQGWSSWTELSSALTAALVRAPQLDTSAFVYGWCAERFSASFGVALAEAYIDSAALIEQGWYSGALGGERSLGKIFLPPLLWIWWMRPTASLLIWAYLVAAMGDRRANIRARDGGGTAGPARRTAGKMCATGECRSRRAGRKCALSGRCRHGRARDSLADGAGVRGGLAGTAGALGCANPARAAAARAAPSASGALDLQRRFSTPGAGRDRCLSARAG